MEATAAAFGMKKPCNECPWRTDVPTGKFTPQRFHELARTCEPGGLVQPIFACHMSPENGEKACAGMLKVMGPEINSIRLAMSKYGPEICDIETDAPLYDSYADMAEANGASITRPRRDYF